MTLMSGEADPINFVAVRCRGLHPSDSGEVARLLLANKTMPPKLECALADVLHALIARERVLGVCVEAIGARAEAPPRAIVAAGLSGFISDDYVEGILKAPPSDITLDILERFRRGDPGGPLLDFDSVARANASDGLNLIPLGWGQHAPPGDGGLGDELAVLRMQMFLDRHKGYRLKRILRQGPRAEEASLLGGGFLPIAPLDAAESPAGRLLFGLTSEQAQAREFASAIGLLFSVRPPRLGLSRKQQQVLIAALDDLSDDEIAAHLGITTHAINMRWRTIYDNLRDRPELETNILRFQDYAPVAQHIQKRRRLTAFVRSHPEELRPYSR